MQLIFAILLFGGVGGVSGKAGGEKALQLPGLAKQNTWTQPGTSVQFSFAQKNIMKIIGEPVQIELKDSKGVVTYRVRCEHYQKVTTVIIFTAEGIFIDYAQLRTNTGNCDDLEKIITPDGQRKLIFLTPEGNIKDRCYARKYHTVEPRRSIYAIVQRSKLTNVKCPLLVTKFLDDISENNHIGIVLWGQDGKFFHDMEYSGDSYEKVGEPEVKSLMTTDQTREFKCICQIITLLKSKVPIKPNQGSTSQKSSTFIAASIVDVANGVVLEKFKMTTCSVNFMKITRYNNIIDSFIFEFKADNGICYRRKYQLTAPIYRNDYFVEKLLDRGDLKATECP